MQTKMNIIQELQKLVDKHVLYYSSDFEVDKEIFAEVANSAHLEEKVMLWLCREHGTHCLRADQVYIRDTAAHNTFRYYAEQNYDSCIARIVIPREIQDGDIVGDIFEIDYQKAVEDVTRNSVEPLVERVFYEDGYVYDKPFKGNYAQAQAQRDEHGEILVLLAVPKNEELLQEQVGKLTARKK